MNTRLLAIGVVGLVMVSAAVRGEGYTHTVPANQSVTVVPVRGSSPTSLAWATNITVSQGQYVHATQGYYMLVSTGSVLTGGSATNAPTQGSEDARSTDGLVWRRVQTQPRTSAIIKLMSGGPIWFREGRGANTNGGFVLTTQYEALRYTGQSEISAASIAGGVVAVGETNQ